MSWLTKAKEKAQEHTILGLFALIGLLSLIVWRAVPSSSWDKVSEVTPKPALWALLGLLAITAILECAYIVDLRRRQKLKPRFGVYWDRNFTPHCPACSKVVVYLKESFHWGFKCVQCSGRFIPLNDDNGNAIEIADARILLSGKQIEEPELDDTDMRILTLFTDPDSVVTLGQVTAALNGKAQYAKHRLSELTERRYIYPSTVWTSPDAPYHLTDKGRAYLIKRHVI